MFCYCFVVVLLLTICLQLVLLLIGGRGKCNIHECDFIRINCWPKKHLAFCIVIANIVIANIVIDNIVIDNIFAFCNVIGLRAQRRMQYSWMWLYQAPIQLANITICCTQDIPLSIAIDYQKQRYTSCVMSSKYFFPFTC